MCSLLFWTYSHIPTLIESIEQHNRVIWWLRCYTAWRGEGYWALLNCSLLWGLNKHATPTQGRKPTGPTEGYKMSYPQPPCSHGGTYIQSFPVSVMTFTTQLFFGRSHKATQHHRCCTWGGVKNLLSTWGREDEFHLGFNTWFKILMILIHSRQWVDPEWLIPLRIPERLSVSGSCSCSRNSYSKQLNFCYLQHSVFEWTSIHFSLFKPGLPAERVRRATYPCQMPDAGQ